MKIDMQDVVLVAVPENTKKYREYGVKFPSAQKDDFQLSRGQVWELGILNHQKNHFKTIREIGSNSYYVVGDGCVKDIKLPIESKGENFENGVDIRTLHQKNKALIKSQLDPVLNQKIAESKKLLRAKKLREELLKDRQEYLNF